MGHHSVHPVVYKPPRFETIAPHIEHHTHMHLARMQEGSEMDRFSVQRDQQVVRDERGTALFVVTKGRWQIRLFGIVLPDTMRAASRGRPLSDIIGHPLTAPGTPCGDVPVRSVMGHDPTKGPSRNRWTEQILLRRPLPPFDPSIMPMIEMMGDYHHLKNDIVPSCLRKIES